MIVRLASFLVLIVSAMLTGCVITPLEQSNGYAQPSNQYGYGPQGPGYGYVAPVQQTPQPAPPSVTPGGRGTFCNIDGMVTREVSEAACVAKAEAKAKTLVSGKNVDMKQQANQPTCSAGKTWAKLNWPGHHQHDGFVCLPDGDPHRY